MLRFGPRPGRSANCCARGLGRRARGSCWAYVPPQWPVLLMKAGFCVRAPPRRVDRMGAGACAASAHLPMSLARVERDDRRPTTPMRSRRCIGAPSTTCSLCILPPEQLDLVQGMPEHVIARTVADRRAELVVLGALRRGQLSPALIGSTAESVAGAVPCDVLLVPPPRAPAELAERATDTAKTAKPRRRRASSATRGRRPAAP